MQSEWIATFTSSERRLHPPPTRQVFLNASDRGRWISAEDRRGGPEAGKPKLPPTAKGLVERGLMRLDTEEHLPRLFFTESGLARCCAPPPRRGNEDTTGRPPTPNRSETALRSPPHAGGTDIIIAAVLWRAVLPCRRRDTRMLVRNLTISVHRNRSQKENKCENSSTIKKSGTKMG